jgi:hypothetical protein
MMKIFLRDYELNSPPTPGVDVPEENEVPLINDFPKLSIEARSKSS